MDKSSSQPDVSAVQTSDPPDYPGFFTRAWNGVLLFLEIIGLRREDTVDQAAQVARLRLYHTEFRKLISANHSFLENLGDLETRLIKKKFTDRAFVKAKVIRLISDVHAMVESINAISSNRYAALREVYDRTSAPLLGVIQESTESSSSEILLDMHQVLADHAELAGGKMANLCEMANTLELPIPDGFVITTEGYQLLIEEGGIRSWIQDKHLELGSAHDVERVSTVLQERILQLEVPAILEEGLCAAYDRLGTRLGGHPALAVRSSAVGEDSDFSFAGQFLSLLNVPREEMAQAYLRVAASLYSPEAIHYRLLHGIPGESAKMAVGFIAMVDAMCSGVVFTQDPSHDDSGMVLIQAVKGLGVLLVDGRTSPEVVLISRNAGRPAIERVASAQKSLVVMSPGAGIQEVEHDSMDVEGPCLSNEEAIQLTEWAMQLERHFGGPQDIEWAMDQGRRMLLLQSRPLRLAAHASSADGPEPGFLLLVEKGEIACPGIAFGRAVHLSENDDLESFPEGGILVARRSSPKFVRLMSKAGAIVTDAGSTTGHMASLAREFRVPTLLNTRVAVQTIPPDAVITVDANSGFVYLGEVPGLAEQAARDREASELESMSQTTPGFRFLKRVIELVSPLNLTDPTSTSFRTEACRTLHDMARFIHEKSYQEMFLLGDNVGDLRASSYQLDVFLPIDLYLIDLGGGLDGTPSHRKVKRSQIASVPLSALLKGMFHEKIQRFGAKPMDLGGFVSIMMRHAMNTPEQDASFRDPCYAIISDNYLNYTARVGYHFSVVDTYCGLTQNKNYISLVFHGGAADFLRRARRVRAIAGVLEHHGFRVKVNQDIVNARLNKPSREEAIVHLEMIGSLLQFFRQMDAAMTSDEAVAVFRDAFLRGDYGLEEMTVK
jgi:pyruvate,water dikinase